MVDIAPSLSRNVVEHFMVVVVCLFVMSSIFVLCVLEFAFCEESEGVKKTVLVSMGFDQVVTSTQC